MTAPWWQTPGILPIPIRLGPPAGSLRAAHAQALRQEWEAQDRDRVAVELDTVRPSRTARMQEDLAREARNSPHDHTCTAACREIPGPVRLGHPERYDRTPVPCGCGGRMQPGITHYCRKVA